MNDKDYAKQKLRVTKLIDQYQRDLGINWFKIEHEFNREYDGDNDAQVAKTTVSWQYITAWIVWNLPQVEKQSDDALRDILFHEYGHVLTGALMQHVDHENNPAADHLIEYTAELIGRTIGYAVDIKPKAAKK